MDFLPNVAAMRLKYHNSVELYAFLNVISVNLQYNTAAEMAAGRLNK